MKNFSRRLKKTAPLILLGLLIDQSLVTQKAQALVGGPFDDNRYPGANADGTYSATATGHNLTGIVTFGVSSSSEGNGRFAIFHEGFVHYGAASGMADLANRKVACSLLGVAPLTGNGQVVLGNPTVTETTGGSGTSALAQQQLTVRSGIEGSFTAKLKGYPQQITFSGNGRLSSTANTAVSSTGSTSAQIDGAGFTVFFDVNGTPKLEFDSPTGDNTGVAATGGKVAVDLFPQRAVLRSETPFKVRGSRTSRTVYTALNSYSSIPPQALAAATTPAVTTPVPTPVVVIP